MNILCVGDVVGSAGCHHLQAVLPQIKKQYAVDVCIVNAENAAAIPCGQVLGAYAVVFER